MRRHVETESIHAQVEGGLNWKGPHFNGSGNHPNTWVSAALRLSSQCVMLAVQVATRKMGFTVVDGDPIKAAGLLELITAELLRGHFVG